MSIKALHLVAVCVCLAGGCSKSEPVPQPQLLKLEEVPDAVMKAAKERLPDVRFDSAWKAMEHGQEVYEIRGKTSVGKTFEVEVTTDGRVVGVE